MQVPSVIIRDATMVTRKLDSGFEIRSQQGVFETAAGLGFECEVPVPDGAQPYPVGRYLVDATSIVADDYGRLKIRKRGIVLFSPPSTK